MRLLNAAIVSLLAGSLWVSSLQAAQLDLAPTHLAQRGMNPGQTGPMYGSDMMTDQERVEHMRRMREAGTVEEQEQIRRENHEIMRERAREKGISMPEEPQMGRGMGQGMGPGMGPGMGRGRRQER